MPRHLRPTLLVCLTALVAGCGGSGDASTPGTSRIAGPAPAADGKLRVGVTDIGIGDAAVGSAGGIELLPSTAVPGSPNTEQGVGAGASCENAALMPTADNLVQISVATLCLLNGERADAGLRALKRNDKLDRAAVRQSRAMVDDQFFDHVGIDGSDPVSRVRATGYIPKAGAWTVGENLAWGTGSLATPKGIVAAWMKSQGHRENILRASYKEIGLGVVTGNPRSTSGSGATFTTTFGAVTKPRPGRSASRARASRKFKARRRAPRGGNGPVARIAIPRGDGATAQFSAAP